MTHLKMSIPEPCTQNWDAMEAQINGRFCGSCEKSVIDFSVMSVKEIEYYFADYGTNRSICGHFKQSQLDSVLIPKHEIFLNKLYSKTESKVRFKFIKMPLLFIISAFMILSGCKTKTAQKKDIVEQHPTSELIKNTHTETNSAQAIKDSLIMEEELIMGDIAYTPHEDTIIVEPVIMGMPMYVPEDSTSTNTPHPPTDKEKENCTTSPTKKIIQGKVTLTPPTIPLDSIQH